MSKPIEQIDCRIARSKARPVRRCMLRKWLVNDAGKSFSSGSMSCLGAPGK